MEFPVHPIQETGKRPTAGLDRNLAYLGLVEVLYGYPLDGVVLTIGCDKTTPAMLMARRRSTFPPSRCRSGRCSTAGIRASAPARARSCGRRARCWPRARSTTAVHRARGVVGALDRLLQYDGHRDDDELAGRGAGHVAARFGGDPAPYRDRQEIAYAPACASSTWCART
jgi:dihydroxy-acid dehydratase